MTGTNQNERRHIEIGNVLEGFKIERELGRGGMGVVYLARELSLNRPVALKVLSERLCLDEEFIDRFKREAQAIAAMNHPNIVSILSYDESDGLYYFAMEYVKGRDLGQILKEKGFLSLVEALSISFQIASALGEFNLKGVVHRDLKPSNIMVDGTGKAMVTDFGVAYYCEGDLKRLTQTGLFLGSPEYTSPEQAEGKELDIRSDIYALGAVMYRMLSGKVPITGTSPLAVITRIATTKVVPIGQLNRNLPKNVCDLIGKMMAKSLSERFQSPEEVVRAVGCCIEELERKEPSRSWRFITPYFCEELSKAKCLFRGWSRPVKSKIILFVNRVMFGLKKLSNKEFLLSNIQITVLAGGTSAVLIALLALWIAGKDLQEKGKDLQIREAAVGRVIKPIAIEKEINVKKTTPVKKTTKKKERIVAEEREQIIAPEKENNGSESESMLEGIM